MDSYSTSAGTVIFLPQDNHNAEYVAGVTPRWPDFSDLGTLLLGAYEVRGRFRGGFATVLYLVEIATGRELAVKVPKVTLGEPTYAYQQFTAEVEFWLNLPPHPNIVKPHFVAEIDSHPALFMEYVAGTSYSSLAKWLQVESIPETISFDLAHQLCIAMEFANRGGEIAHRDIKPQNLLISGETSLKLTDFGSAVRVEIQGNTFPKVTSGSWPYAAPEMLRREVADTRSDIYSFGVVLFQMLMGRLPFPFALDPAPNKWYRQLAEFYSSRDFRFSYGLGQELTECSNAGVSDIVKMCLAPEPAVRPRDFAQLLRLMNEALNVTGPTNQNAVLSAENLFDMAVNLRKLGKYDEALTKLNLLLAKHPQHPRRSQFLTEVAETLRLNGSPREALRFEQSAERPSRPASRS